MKHSRRLWFQGGSSFGERPLACFHVIPLVENQSEKGCEFDGLGWAELTEPSSGRADETAAPSRPSRAEAFRK